MSTQFSEADIKDKDKLEKMIEKEANAIYQSSVSRRGRDLDTIKHCVRQGKVAELWLIENEGYTESDIKWHDLKSSNGEYTEVKAYTGVWSKDAPYVQKDLRRLKNESWSRSKWYKLFRVENGIYELIDTVEL